MQFRIFRFEHLSSTNDEAGQSKYKNGDIIVADYQSNGRGQRGNTWHSVSGENLLFSLVIEPQNLRAVEAFALSQTIAVAVAHTLLDFGIKGVEIKWPNDILIKGRKIAGVLIENCLCAEFVSRSVIGVGINVLQRDFASIKELEATSLANQGAVTVGIRDVLEKICENFAKIYTELPREDLHSIYMDLLYRKQGVWKFRDNKVNEEIEASISSIDLNIGVMELELVSGEHRSYYFKEVSFLLASEQTPVPPKKLEQN